MEEKKYPHQTLCPELTDKEYFEALQTNTPPPGYEIKKIWFGNDPKFKYMEKIKPITEEEKKASDNAIAQMDYAFDECKDFSYITDY